MKRIKRAIFCFMGRRPVGPPPTRTRSSLFQSSNPLKSHSHSHASRPLRLRSLSLSSFKPSSARRHHTKIYVRNKPAANLFQHGSARIQLSAAPNGLRVQPPDGGGGVPGLQGPPRRDNPRAHHWYATDS
jgi:hypothetical protein